MHSFYNKREVMLMRKEIHPYIPYLLFILLFGWLNIFSCPIFAQDIEEQPTDQTTTIDTPTDTETTLEIEPSQSIEPEVEEIEILDPPIVETTPTIQQDVSSPLLQTNETQNTDEFYRIFHVDSGRKYFTVDQIKEMIDLAVTNNYTHIELTIGNEGLRFLLDDMSVETIERLYSSQEVADAIHKGNLAFNNEQGKNNPNYTYEPTINEWTQSEMDSMISYAHQKGIGVIPLLNSPGHMNTIVYAMQELGISNAAFSSSGKKSTSTMNMSNGKAIEFTTNLIQKYIDYYANQGSVLFNLGCDEYASDIGRSFKDLIDANLYDQYVDYINTLANQVKNAGMKPVAFNDGFYYGSQTDANFDTDIVICYWHKGWGQYTYQSSQFLFDKGHAIINTNASWYFVLGNPYPFYRWDSAAQNVINNDVYKLYDGNILPVIGSMFCLWCDIPSMQYVDMTRERLNIIMENQKNANPDEFISASQNISITETTIEGIKDNYAFTNTYIRPNVIVKKDGVPLIEDFDYTLTYQNNIDIGTATITIIGKGTYFGQATKTFTIQGIKNGLLIENGKIYYYINDIKQKGQKKINGYWYMFDMNDYSMRTGWFNHTQQTNPSGGPKTTYYDSKGHMLYGFQNIQNNWYWLNPSSGKRELTGVVKNTKDNKWYFVRNGIGEKFTGWSKSIENGKWYFTRNGILDWSFTGVAKSVENGKWYHGKNGRLDWNFTGFSKSVENGKWYFSRKGALDWSFTGVAKSIENGKWYFAKKGVLDWGYTGGAKSVENGKWYAVQKGSLKWNYNGKLTCTDKKIRTFRNGAAI